MFYARENLQIPATYIDNMPTKFDQNRMQCLDSNAFQII